MDVKLSYSTLAGGAFCGNTYQDEIFHFLSDLSARSREGLLFRAGCIWGHNTGNAIEDYWGQFHSTACTTSGPTTVCSMK